MRVKQIFGENAINARQEEQSHFLSLDLQSLDLNAAAETAEIFVSYSLLCNYKRNLWIRVKRG